MKSLKLREKNVKLLKKTLKHLNKHTTESSKGNENDENRIQTDYVMKILREAINKLKILFQLPAIVENEPKLLGKYLRQGEVEFISKMYQKPAVVEEDEIGENEEKEKEENKDNEEDQDIQELYVNRDMEFRFGEFDPDNLSTISMQDTIYSFKMSLDETEDEMGDDLSAHDQDSPQLKHIRHALKKFITLEQNRDHRISRMTPTQKKNKHHALKKRAYFTQCMDFVMHSKGLVNVLKERTAYHKQESFSTEEQMISAVETLMKVFWPKLNVSCQEHLEHENEAALAYSFGLVLDENIAELERYTSEKEQEYTRKQREKMIIISRLSQKVNELKMNNGNKENKMVAESEGAMLRKIDLSEDRQEHLAVEAENTTQLYESLLQSHLKDEKYLKSQQVKGKAQVAAWMAKYDMDMGESQARLDELEEQSRKLKKEIEDVYDRLDDQQNLYQTLMEEKAVQEKIMFEETLLNFVRNRSARIIQRTWNAYKAKKLAQKLARMKKAKAKGMSGAPKPLRTKKDKKKEKRVREVVVKRIKDPPPKTLEQKYGEDLFKNLSATGDFTKSVTVDLS